MNVLKKYGTKKNQSMKEESIKRPTREKGEALTLTRMLEFYTCLTNI